MTKVEEIQEKLKWFHMNLQHPEDADEATKSLILAVQGQERERQKENEMLDANGQRMLVEEYTGQTPRRVMKVRYHYASCLGKIGAFVEFVYDPIFIPDNVRLNRTYIGWLYTEYPASVLAPTKGGEK